MEITALPAFSDNYIWVIRSQSGNHDDQPDCVAVVDPGEAAPVLDYLRKTGSALCAILITHRHSDHIGGVSELLRHAEVPVYGPAAEQDKITTLTHVLREGDSVSIPELDLELSVLDVGGHTLGHIAYLADIDGQPALFCGDTLFAGGCGRLFEGTPQQMFASLGKLAILPADTRVYCAHEYTQSNLKFARVVEPGNAALKARCEEVDRLRAEHRPTVPSLLGTELATNPFLRWHSPEVVAAARKFSGNETLQDPVGVFAAIREWKNVF
jgi:hydroxyacylglutathione hydrolase